MNKRRLVVLVLMLTATFITHTMYQAHARGPEGYPSPSGVGDRRAPLWPGPDPSAAPGDVRIEAHADRRAVLQHGDGTVHLEVTITTPEAQGALRRMPSDMVVVIDRSGSMSGEKLEYAKQALHQLIERLEDDDRLGIVAYHSDAEVVVPLESARGSRREWSAQVDALFVGGSTNMSAGLDLALDMLAKHRRSDRAGRLLLLSDGLANMGDSSPSGLARRAETALRMDVVLSTMGIGSDFDERIMTSLARSGGGAFYYLQKLAMLPAFLDAELRTAAETYAQGAELLFKPGPGVRVTTAAGQVIERGGTAVIPLGSLYAAHQRRLWLTLKVPAGQLGHHRVGDIELSYRRGDRAHHSRLGALPSLECVADFPTFRSKIERDVWERAMLEEEVHRAQEELGDAIVSGKKSDVKRAVAHVQSKRKLAESLGSQVVLEGIREVEASAARAEQAQQAPAPARNLEAKRMKATGYMNRSRGNYKNIDPTSSF